MAKRKLNATGKAPTKTKRGNSGAAVAGTHVGTGFHAKPEGAFQPAIGRVGDTSRRMNSPAAVTGAKTGGRSLTGKTDTAGQLKTIKRSDKPQRLRG